MQEDDLAVLSILVDEENVEENYDEPPAHTRQQDNEDMLRNMSDEVTDNAEDHNEAPTPNSHEMQVRCQVEDNLVARNDLLKPTYSDEELVEEEDEDYTGDECLFAMDTVTKKMNRAGIR